MWSQYLGKYTFMGETRNGAPIYAKEVPNTWAEKTHPPTLARNADGRWYVQSPSESENGGNIFACKISYKKSSTMIAAKSQCQVPRDVP